LLAIIDAAPTYDLELIAQAPASRGQSEVYVYRIGHKQD
jgi:hypothetical protein